TDNKVSNSNSLSKHREEIESKFGKGILEEIENSIDLSQDQLFKHIRRARMDIIKESREYSNSLSGDVKNVYNKEETSLDGKISPQYINSMSGSSDNIKVNINDSKINSMNRILSDINTKIDRISTITGGLDRSDSLNLFKDDSTNHDRNENILLYENNNSKNLNFSIEYKKSNEE